MEGCKSNLVSPLTKVPSSIPLTLHFIKIYLKTPQEEITN